MCTDKFVILLVLTVAIHILPNISSKGNQTMKFGQLIEYNMRNIFLEKSYTKMWWRNYSQTLSWKTKINHIYGSIVSSLIQFFFIVSKVEGYRNILKLSCRSLVFTSYKASSNNKKRSGTNQPASFSAWFLKKNISLVIFF